MNKNILIKFALLCRSAVILLAFLSLGKWLQQVSALPVPGSILGLILLFTALSLRLIPLAYLLPTGNLLLYYITLFFVPVGVGLLQYSALLSEHWLTIVIASGVSTVAVLLSVGWCYQRLTR